MTTPNNPQSSPQNSSLGIGFVTIAFPCLALIPALWFNLVTWPAVMLTFTHMLVIAPYGLLTGALLKRVSGRNQSFRARVQGILALLLLSLPYVLLYLFLYEQRPLPADSYDFLMWRMLTFSSSFGAMLIGSAFTFQLDNATRT